MSKTKAENLMVGLLKEMNRNRELLKEYEDIGPAGSFGATMIRMDIEKAEEAIKDNDVIKMMIAYNSLTETK